MTIHIMLAFNVQGRFSELISTLPICNPDFVVSQALLKMPENHDRQPIDIVALDGTQTHPALMGVLQQYQTQTDTQKFVIYDFQESVQRGINYLAAGVTGLFKHECAATQLAEKLRGVQAGQVYIEPELAQVLAMRQIRRLLQPFNALCSRDYDVFCLLAEGLSIDEIALQLGVSSKTVFNCQTQVKKRLYLNSKTEIQEFAKNHGII